MKYTYWAYSFSSDNGINEWMVNNPDWEPFLMSRSADYRITVIFRKTL